MLKNLILKNNNKLNQQSYMKSVINYIQNHKSYIVKK